MKTIKIYVTEDHISKGKFADARACPVARAIRKQIGVSWIKVLWDQVSFIRGGRQQVTTIPLPRSARRFIQHYDDGDKVRPFNFLLKVKN